MHLGERDPGTGERERRLDEPGPRQPAQPLPQLSERGGEAGNGAGGRPDGVDDELVAEGDRQLRQLAAALVVRAVIFLEEHRGAE